MSRVRTPARPAHRPSRRTHIIDAAMRLFARMSFDDVTVGDIAEAAEMTPAAVYYHFAGKEQILLEGTRTLTAELIALARQGVEEGAEVGSLVTSMLEHVKARRTVAAVYFVNSAGLNVALEAHRKTVRAELTELFMRAARRARPKLSTAEIGVMGAALVSLLEVSAAASLNRDRSVRGVAGGVPAAVTDLANRIVGGP